MNTRTTALLALLLGFFTVGLAQAKEKVSLKADGITLNANLEMAEGKSLSDGVILLTHGTLAHNEMEIIRSFQELLTERGHNTLAINLSLGIDNRASSMYDCKVPHTYRYLDAVDEITRWVNWLKSKGAGKIAVLGHSRGGAQTAAYAAQTNDAAIHHVILVAPATWSQEKSEKGYEKTYRTKLGPLLTRAENLVTAGKGGEMLSKVGMIYCPNSTVTANAFVSNYKPDMRRHSPSLFSSIKMPILVIAGSDDTVVKGLSDIMKPLADGKKLHFKLIEEADHFFRDFAAEEVADAIDEFIKP